MSSNSDNSGISPRAHNITAFVEAAAAQLRELDTSPCDEGSNGDSRNESGALLYFGNWQDPIPRLLILDRTLDANDVRLWAYLRTLFTQPGMPTVFPSYKEIQRDLPMARATLASCISTLRSTRWITRCATVRDNRGRYKGNIYALNEEPLNLADTLHLDDEYMLFLAKATHHHSRRVQTIACAVLNTIRERIGEDNDITTSPTVLKQIEHRLLEVQSLSQTITEANRTASQSSWSAIGGSQSESLSITEPELIHSIDPSSNIELGKTEEKSPSSNIELGENGEKVPSSNSELGKIDEKCPSSKSELGEKNNLRTSICSCCSSCCFNKKTTTTKPSTNNPRAREEQETNPGELILPPSLKPNEQPLVIMQIERIPEEMRQDVLDQLAAGLTNKNRREPVRDPVAYLRTLCQCVLSGEFEMTSRGLAVKEQRLREAARQKREQEAAEAHDRKVKAHLESIKQRSNNRED